MKKGFFDVLRDDSDSSSDSSASSESQQKEALHNAEVPSFEDLSLCRADEETVLQAVYGSDFSIEEGHQGRASRLNVHVRPPDTDKDHVGTQLVLSVKLHKQYPYSMPKLQFKDVQGLTKQEQTELMELVTARAKQLSQSGSVMMVELVQVMEDFLLEHNRDPNMSAWEQMKAREEREKEKERKLELEQQEAMHQMLGRRNEARSDHSGTKSPMSSSRVTMQSADIASSDITRELTRQIEALEVAWRLKQGEAAGDAKGFQNDGQGLLTDAENPLIGFDNEDDDYSDMQSDNEDDPAAYAQNWGGTSGSRYQADFIELGVLGRGGGGEVVKVRNRLDRRIYAVKKIILESERGSFAQAAAIQNRKLRREVTTISRMTHKNIVRYYQAWVEGEIESIREASTVKQHSTDFAAKQDTVDRHEGEDELSSSDSDIGKGYWAKPTLGKFFSDNGDDSESSVSKEVESESDDDEQGDHIDWESSDQPEAVASNPLHSRSTEDLLALENEYGIQVGVKFALGCELVCLLLLSWLCSSAKPLARWTGIPD
jgi:eukaryotic translation initiation factor 2-alpha kinase 4